MKRINLNGLWEMTGNGYCCQGNIPGSVYSFLLDNKLMEDPFYRDNELAALELMEHAYTFSRSFPFSHDGNTVLLCCDGLDTLCAITVNGKEVAYTKNMHRRYEFDVTNLLHDGQNEIALRFDSSPAYIREQRAACKQDVREGNYDALNGYPHLRKAHYMLGWDWGARLPDAGIWRDIYLLVKDSARITDHRIIQRHENGAVYITPLVKTDMPCPIRVSLTAPDGTTTVIPANEESRVENPALWWPNGMGEQPLYTVTAEIEGDQSVKRIGLRTLRLIRENDQWGQSFCHEVNGVRFFAMGADYIPEDNVLTRITPERSRRLLMQAKTCNFNTIRIWGGGYYPDDWFFDLCDELGLVLFFDMMVACCWLPDSEEIRAEMEAETRDNLLRIRHHACIGLISGNNEVEEMGTPPMNLAANYLYIFENMMPTVIKELCPEIAYVPSSPSSIGHYVNPRDENYGDSHYWNVWHFNAPYVEYRKHFFRYLSEFGFQSFPCEKTVNAFTLPEDRNIFSPIMERHQRNDAANGKILAYLANTFLYPTDFSTLLYASQLLQATAIRYGTEHLRRNRGRCMGTLYWQFNDNWPVASWASIDYFGRYKALQYAAKRFYQPIMISCDEIGENRNRRSINDQNGQHTFETSAALSVNNDTMEEVRGRVCWKLCNADSQVLKSGFEDITVPALSVVTLERIDFNQTDAQHNHLFYSFEVDGVSVSSGSVLFTAPKHYAYRDPELTCTIDGNTITVHAKAFAQWVEIDSPDSDFILDDNYFDMEAGTRTLTILEGTPGTIRLRSVYNSR